RVEMAEVVEPEGGVLVEGPVAVVGGAVVDPHGAGQHGPSDVVAPAGLPHLGHSDHVGVGGVDRLPADVVDVGVGGEVEDGIGAGEGLDEGVEIVDVSGDVADIGAVRWSQVDDGDVVAGQHETVHHVRSDEASAAGHQGTHGNRNPSCRSATEP